MSEVQNGATGEQAVAEPYPSFAALRDAHTELLKSHREMADRPTFLDDVEEFCQRALATGALLNLDDDRRASQSLLNYWVTTLYGNDRMPTETILADFDSSLIPKIDDAACPYPGSRAFGEDDAKNFFGRQIATVYILNRLKVDRLLALIGPSGRGKTSLVLAGILPALRGSDNLSGRKRFYFPFLIPGSDPLGSLDRMVKGSGSDSTERIQSPFKGFKRNPKHLLELIKQATDLPVVIVVDQFEDLFTLCNDKKAQRAFIANLINVVQEPGAMHIVIITMRSDSYDDEIKRLPRAFRELLEPAKWTLPPLGADEIGDAIQKPADKVGLRFQESTVLSLIKEILSEPIGLPLLQFALQKLWAKRELNTIPDKVLKELGGCRIAFVRAADQLYKELKPEEKLTARRLLMRMVKVDDEGKVTEVPVLRTELVKGDKRERVDHVLQRLIQEGLLRLSEHKEPADVQVELTHNSLIRSWEEMATWVGAKKTKQRLFKYAAMTFLALGFLLVAALSARAFFNWRHDMRAFLSHRIARQSDTLLRSRRFNLAMLLGLHAYRLDDNADSRSSILNALRLGPRPLKFLYKQNYQAAGLALSPDKKKLATLDESGNISIWHLDTEPTTERVLTSSGTASYPVVFSADGKTLASASSITREKELVPDPQSTIRLWDVSTGVPRNLFVDADYRVTSLAFAPNGNALISGGADGRVFRWDLAKDSPEKTPFITFPSSVRAVSFNPQGTFITCGSSDGTTILWDVSNWQRLRIFGKPDKAKKQVQQTDEAEEVWFVSFSPDGKMLAVDSLKNTVVWDVATGAELLSVSNEREDFGLTSAFSEDGRTLTSYSGDGNVFVWDLVDGGGSKFHGTLDGSAFLALSTDARILALPSEDGITLWDIGSRRTLRVPTDNTDTLTNINTLAFDPTPNAQTLAAGLNDGQIILWDTATRKQIGKLEPTTKSAATSLAFSPDGKTLAEGLFNGTSLLWNVANRAQLTEPLKGPAGSVVDLVFSPDGKRLAAIINPGSVGSPNIVVLWNMDSWDEHLLENIGRSITSIAFSNDGKTLFAGDTDGKIFLWDIANQRSVAELAAQDSSIVSLRLDPSGKRLVSGNNGGTLIVWDVSDLSQIRQVGAKSGVAVSQLAFSPSGETLGILRNPDESAHNTRSGQRGLVLVDLKSGSQLGDPITSRSGQITSFAFRSDGKMVASGSTDLTIDLWDINISSAEDFCSIVNANLSQEDWNTFVGGDKKYCRICSTFGPGEGAPDKAPACKYSGWRAWW